MTPTQETIVDRTIDGLTGDEVRQISLLIETLDRSTLDFLQVDAAGVKITISKSGAGLGNASTTLPAGAAASAPALAPTPTALPQPNPPQAVATPSATPVAPGSSVQDGTVIIPAPLMGRFYPLPEPGAAPFVMIGSAVEEDTVVGLIEVMKLFNTVHAGVRGTITEICAPAGEFLEYGTPLFRVRPAAADASKGASA